MSKYKHDLWITYTEDNEGGLRASGGTLLFDFYSSTVQEKIGELETKEIINGLWIHYDKEGTPIMCEIALNDENLPEEAKKAFRLLPRNE